MAHRRGEFADPWTDQGSLFRTGGRGLDYWLLKASAGLESMGVGDGIG
jgi:hypothetical protein